MTDVPAQPLTFRSRLAQVLAVLVALVGVAALAAFIAESGMRGLLTTAAPVGLAVTLGWAMFWRPRAIVDDSGITLVNVIRTVQVPWPVFRAADTRWALTITTDDARFTSWGVPAGSGFGARLVPLGRRGEGFSPADSKLRSSGTAEAAAVAIAERVRQRRTGSARGGPDQVTVTTHGPLLVTVGVLTALTVLSAVLG